MYLGLRCVYKVAITRRSYFTLIRVTMRQNIKGLGVI